MRLLWTTNIGQDNQTSARTLNRRSYWKEIRVKLAEQLRVSRFAFLRRCWLCVFMYLCIYMNIHNWTSVIPVVWLTSSCNRHCDEVHRLNIKFRLRWKSNYPLVHLHLTYFRLIYNNPQRKWNLPAMVARGYRLCPYCGFSMRNVGRRSRRRV